MEIKSRRDFIKFLGGVGAGCLLPREMIGLQRARCASIVSPDFPALGAFSYRVLNSFSAQIFNSPASVLFEPRRNLHKMVSQGELDIAFTAACRLSCDDISALFNSLPFGLSASEHRQWMKEQGREFLKEFYQEQKLNLVSFNLGNVGTQNGGWLKSPLTSLDQFKNMNTRSCGLTTEVLGRLGAKCGNFSHARNQQNLAEFDYFEWGGSYLDERFNISRAFNYYIESPWQNPNISFQLLVNKNFWAQLGEDRKMFLERFVANLDHQLTTYWEHLDKTTPVNVLKRKTELPVSVQDTLKDLAYELSYKLPKSELQKEILDSYFSFKRDFPVKRA